MIEYAIEVLDMPQIAAYGLYLSDVMIMVSSHDHRSHVAVKPSEKIE